MDKTQHTVSREWVPVRSLAPRHRALIAAHLLALVEEDRYLRFGYLASDEQINAYVEKLDFDRDEIFGIYDERLELIAVAHLANSTVASSEHGDLAEFGVSVLPLARGRGLGGRLFRHAVMHARNRGRSSLLIHALTENVAMLKIAHAAGAVVERNGSESEAWLKLPPETVLTQIGEFVEEQAAELDYRMKVRANRVYDFLDRLGEVKSLLNRRIASE